MDCFDRALAWLLILDTTTMAAYVFAALCLLSIMVGNMGMVIHCMRFVLDFLAGALHFATMGARLRHLVERLMAYYCPGGQVGKRGATLRVISTLLVLTGAYAVFLKPATLYLWGFTGGWTAEHGELTVSCVSAFDRFINAGVTSLTEWHQTCRCFGEEDGISWQAWLQDWYTSPVDGDINHLPGIICALAGLVLSAWLSSVYFVAIWVNQPPSEPEDTVTMPREEVEEYQSLLRQYQKFLGQYPGLVDQCVSIIRGLEDAMEHGKLELARRSDALRIKQEMLQASWEANRRLSEVRLVQEESRRQTDPTNTELRLEVAKLTRKFELAKRDVDRVERSKAEMSTAWTEKVAMLQSQLAARDEAVTGSQSECASLRDRVLTREQQLMATESSLAAVEAAMKRAEEQSRESAIQCDRLKESYDQLKASHDNIMAGCQSMLMASQERDQATAQVATLQAELAAVKSEANNVVTRLQQDLSTVRQAVEQSERAHREELTALEAVVSEKCRDLELHAATDAWLEAEGFDQERADLQGQVEKAVLELQESQTSLHRSQEQVNGLNIEVSFLEDRLAKFEDRNPQELTPRKMFDVPAIQRGLARSELTVATQLSEIADLKKQLRVYREGGVTEPTDATLQAQVDRLKTVLAAEKSAHTNDQLRLNKQIQDLETRNQKLQISISNAEAGLNRRAPVRNSPLRRA